MAGMRRVLIAATAVALLAGCASTGASEPSESPVLSTPEVSPTPNEASAPEVEEPGEPEAVALDAAALAAALVDAVDSATGFTEYTEDNDPNDLIGRPGGYVSAAAVSDEGSETPDELGVAAGAVIEVYGSEDEAATRSEYILGILKDAPALGSEWHHLSGAALLRVSGDLKPSVNEVYAQAWASIVG